MTPPRRDRAREGGAAGRRWLALGVLLAALLVGFLFSTGAYSLVEAPRISTVDVTDDQAAELGLVVYSCVDKDNIDPLVDVTNNFEESVSVTVSLVDGSLGTLHVGSQSGGSVTFSLAVGGNTTVFFETTARGPYPKTLDFVIDASGSVTRVTASRSSQIQVNCQ